MEPDRLFGEGISITVPILRKAMEALRGTVVLTSAMCTGTRHSPRELSAAFL